MQLQRSNIVRTVLLVSITLSFFVGLAGVAQAQIVAFGASNVAGKGVFPNQAWPAQLEGLLKAKGYNVFVKNAGVSGNTTKQMLNRLDSAIPAGTKIVILDFSGGFRNNSKSDISPEQGKADMKGIVDRLKSRGIRIIPERTDGTPTTLKQPDHIHLNAAGHRVLAEHLLPEVIAALGGSH
jgi:acyl-CoA thioesterase-1